MKMLPRANLCSTIVGGANSVEQISTRVQICTGGANYAHERNLLSHMSNLILDFDKLPIFLYEQVHVYENKLYK